MEEHQATKTQHALKTTRAQRLLTLTAFISVVVQVDVKSKCLTRNQSADKKKSLSFYYIVFFSCFSHCVLRGLFVPQAQVKSQDVFPNTQVSDCKARSQVKKKKKNNELPPEKREKKKSFKPPSTHSWQHRHTFSLSLSHVYFMVLSEED
jgi:hypothetical protein